MEIYRSSKTRYWPWLTHQDIVNTYTIVREGESYNALFGYGLSGC